MSPLRAIINQTLNTGINSDKLKIAKVIPLLKKDDKNENGQLSFNFTFGPQSRKYSRKLYTTSCTDILHKKICSLTINTVLEQNC